MMRKQDKGPSKFAFREKRKQKLNKGENRQKKERGKEISHESAFKRS